MDPPHSRSNAGNEIEIGSHKKKSAMSSSFLLLFCSNAAKQWPCNARTANSGRGNDKSTICSLLLVAT